MDYPHRSLRMVISALLAGGVLGLAACSGSGDKQANTEGGARNTPASRTAVGARQLSESELRNLLLPLGAVPLRLTPTGQYLLPNDEVAKFFPDPDFALSAMMESGRVQGAASDYALPSSPRATEQVVAVSSSIAWYKTAAGARRVIIDPGMELVIHRFGLDVAEITTDTVAQESRAFRGYRNGDAPDRAAYLILFRRDNLIGAVVVVVPAATDDGGKLAVSLARRQASLPLPGTSQR